MKLTNLLSLKFGEIEKCAVLDFVLPQLSDVVPENYDDVQVRLDTSNTLVVCYRTPEGRLIEDTFDPYYVLDGLKASLRKQVRYFYDAEDNQHQKISTGPTTRKVHLPPGSLLLRWSRFVFPKKFVESEIQNTVYDMQREYMEALAAGHKQHVRWICIRGYMSYCVCVFCGIVGGVGKKIMDAWKGVSPS